MAATTIAVEAGDNQIGIPEEALDASLEVIVTDASGDPVAGVTVAWAVGSGGGSVSAATSVTDSDGIATVDWTLGPDTGAQSCVAQVSGLSGSPISFIATGAIVTVANVKNYLRIETDAEDALIADLIVEATGLVQAMVDTPLTHGSVTWYDEAQSMRLNSGVTNLIIKNGPIDAATLVITNGNGDVVASDTYNIRQQNGLVMGRTSNFTQGPSWNFSDGPYTLTAIMGFEYAPNYTTVLLPLIKALLIDYTAYLWQQRTLGTSSEGAAGTRVDFVVDAETGLPQRIARPIRRLRGIVFGR